MSQQASPGRVALITGAAGAIAGSVAERFARAGWRLALLDLERNQDRLAERQPDAYRRPVDLTDWQEVRRTIEGVEAELGRVDALLNIAGGFSAQSAAEATPDDLERQFALNLRTLFNTTTAALPGMIERGEGFVLGVAAAAALQGRARQPAYGAAKAAVVGYLRAVCAEVEPRGVGVTILYPMGAVDTPGNRRAMPAADPANWISREALADTVLFLAERRSGGRIRELQFFP